MKANILGDIRAENDITMLDQAFFETSDYKSLLESSDRCVIVGRRGTGKSALVHKLSEYWHNQSRTFVVTVAPKEDQIIGLRGLLNLFGDNFIHIKAGAKLAWRYALYMETLSRLNGHYKFKKYIDQSKISSSLKDWGAMKTSLRNLRISYVLH